MMSKQYPQFILFGDSIIQFSSLLRDGFCFGAGLEEREFPSILLWLDPRGHTFFSLSIHLLY
jgi:hypothetical protein